MQYSAVLFLFPVWALAYAYTLEREIEAICTTFTRSHWDGPLGRSYIHLSLSLILRSDANSHKDTIRLLYERQMLSARCPCSAMFHSQASERSDNANQYIEAAGSAGLCVKPSWWLRDACSALPPAMPSPSPRPFPQSPMESCSNGMSRTDRTTAAQPR